MLTASRQQLRVTISTAEAVEGSVIDAIKHALEQKFEQKIEVETNIDTSLIGGALIRSKDWVIDASVKAQLAQMAKELILKG